MHKCTHSYLSESSIGNNICFVKARCPDLSSLTTRTVRNANVGSDQNAHYANGSPTKDTSRIKRRFLLKFVELLSLPWPKSESAQTELNLTN